jgi:ABC-type lipoprotein release transport system permease subunit
MLSRLVERFLYGVRATDWLTYAAGASVLLVMAVVATLAPARRAARVDPLVAMRAE